MDKAILSTCQSLASSDQYTRINGFRAASNLIQKNPEIDDLTLQKLCKGLYYSLWLTDDFIQINRLSVEIIQIYKKIKSTVILNGSQNLNNKRNLNQNEVDNRLRYLRCLMETVAREWPMLDKNKVDKILLFYRIFVSEVLLYMNELEWDLLALNKLGEIYLNKNVFNNNSLGLLLHFIQVYINEFVLNYEHLKGTDETSLNEINNLNKNKNKTNSKSQSTNSHKANRFHEIDGIKLLYILKPFIVMFVNTKDKLVVKTINEYIFNNLERVNKITNVSIVFHLLKKIVESKTEDEGDDDSPTNRVSGVNKRAIKNTLMTCEKLMDSNITENEMLHIDQMLYSIFPTSTNKNGMLNNVVAPKNGKNKSQLQSTQGIDKADSENEELELYDLNALKGATSDESFISLSNVSTTRMSAQRLRNLIILNKTKNFLIRSRASDQNSANFLEKLEDPRIKNQLFYLALMKIKRLRLMYKFKNNQLNKIYDFNKNFKSNFNINLEQAINNIKYVKPFKSSLINKTNNVESEDKKQKRRKKVVFNLKKNQVTNIPSRRIRTCTPLALLV